MKLMHGARLSQQKREAGADQVTDARGSMCPHPHCQTDWGGSVAAGPGVQMGPSKHCPEEHTAFDIRSPNSGSVSPFAPFQPYARQKAGKVFCKNNFPAYAECAHSERCGCEQRHKNLVSSARHKLPVVGAKFLLQFLKNSLQSKGKCTFCCVCGVRVWCVCV